MATATPSVPEHPPITIRDRTPDVFMNMERLQIESSWIPLTASLR